MMLRICSWCRWPMGIKRGRAGVTHGICAPCARRVQRCPETSWPSRLARAIEASADAACWLVIIAGYLLGMAMLYAALERSAHGGETVEVVATAYSWRERSHRRWGDRNAIGSSLRRHVEGMAQIAVDPRRIPLGSIVRVEGLGRRIATDTGGLIVGGKIDIHWQSVGDMRAWGTRRVEIEVIRRGWGGGKDLWRRRGEAETRPGCEARSCTCGGEIHAAAKPEAGVATGPPQNFNRAGLEGEEQMDAGIKEWARFSLEDAKAWAESRGRWRLACETVVCLIHGGRPRAAVVAAWMQVQRN